MCAIVLMTQSRSLGYAESTSLLFGLCIGPGLLMLPSLFQSAGFVWTSIALAITGLFAFSSCWMLLYSQARLSKASGNKVHFLLLCRDIFPDSVFRFVASLFTLSLSMMSLGGMLQVTLAMDYFITNYFGSVCGVQLYPLDWICTDSGSQLFSGGSIVISEGYIASVLLIAPMSLFRHEAIRMMHVILHVALLHVLLWLCLVVSSDFDSSRVPVLGSSFSTSKLLGTCFFSFTVAIAVPTWNTERLLTTGAKRTLALAMASATAVMVVVGYILACSGDDLVGNLIESFGMKQSFGAIACITFLSIIEHTCSLPVISVMLYHTVSIVHDGHGTKVFIAQLAGTVIPWLAVIPLYPGGPLVEIVEYGGLFFTCVTCFVIPPMLFIHALREASALRVFDISVADTNEEQLLLFESIKMHVNVDERDMLNEQFPVISSSREIFIAYSVAVIQLGLAISSLLICLVSTLGLVKHESHWKFFSSNSNFCHTNLVCRVAYLAPLHVCIVNVLLVIAYRAGLRE